MHVNIYYTSTYIYTVGFDPALAPLELTGNHLTPQQFHAAMQDPNAIMIDVRNYNETLIGKFAPPVSATATPAGAADVVGGTVPGSINGKVLDPCMRRSTE